MFYQIKKLLTIGLLLVALLLGIELIGSAQGIAEAMEVKEDMGRIAAQYEQMQINFGVMARTLQGQIYKIEYLEKEREALFELTSNTRPASHYTTNDAWREPFESWAEQFNDDAVEQALGSGGFELTDPNEIPGE
jgi:hypothetical protein